MKININLETNYNVGDMVYAIEIIPIYNILYMTGVVWDVANITFDKPLEIEERVIRQYNNTDFKIFYKINKYLYEETEIFKDLYSALEECEKRNEKLNNNNK